MGRRSDFPENELAWMETRKKDCITAQKSRSVRKWLSTTTAEFFDVFGTPDPTAAQLEKAGQNVEEARQLALTAKKKVTTMLSSVEHHIHKPCSKSRTGSIIIPARQQTVKINDP